MSIVYIVFMFRNFVIKNESCMCMIEDVVLFFFILNFFFNNWFYLCGGDKNKLIKEKIIGI